MLYILTSIAAAAAPRSAAFSAPNDYNPIAPLLQPGVPFPSPASQPSSAASVSLGATVHSSSPYIFGTNLPVYWGREYSRTNATHEQLRAAASFVRWPGGSPVNQYIPDGNWSGHPYFQKWQGQYGSDDIQTPDELILTCKATGSEPLVQMNAALALVEGVQAAVDMSLWLLRKFHAAGLTVRYVSFGNEDYGPWETPYGDYPVDGELYGKAFSSWVDGMRAEFPDVYYGVVGLWTPDDGVSDGVNAQAAVHAHRASAATNVPPERQCHPETVCVPSAERVGIIPNWMGDMLTKTDAVQKADWLVLHDYFYKLDTPISTDALLSNGEQLHEMPKGVEAFINKFAPGTPLPALALTEFNIATTYSAGGNATSRLSGALFLATTIGETLASAPVAALNEFGWHARWAEKASTSGSYGAYTFGSPTWAGDVPDGTLLPKWFALALSKKVTGRMVLAATSSKSSLKAYASEFTGGEVGLLLINHHTEPVSVSIRGLFDDSSRRARFPHGMALNAWVLEGNSSSITPALSANGTALDAPAVTVNGVGNGLPLGGPWPIDTIAPYEMAISPQRDLTLVVPAAALLAAVLHGARPPFPSPPPSPPFPPPSPPPPCPTQSYGNCLTSHCCVDSSKYGCYKRPTKQYAQCRPLVSNCVDTADWLCPGWWE